jgi:ferredoxin
MSNLVIDRTACAGHGLCYTSAPQLLDADEQGNPVLLVDPLGEDALATARRLTSVCPERALSIAESS